VRQGERTTFNLLDVDQMICLCGVHFVLLLQLGLCDPFYALDSMPVNRFAWVSTVTRLFGSSQWYEFRARPLNKFERNSACCKTVKDVRTGVPCLAFVLIVQMGKWFEVSAIRHETGL
jgi:hypothetical protein